MERIGAKGSTGRVRSDAIEQSRKQSSEAATASKRDDHLGANRRRRATTGERTLCWPAYVVSQVRAVVVAEFRTSEASDSAVMAARRCLPMAA